MAAVRRGAPLFLALFVFAGYFKAAGLLRPAPVDLTLAFGAITAGFCLLGLWRERRLPPQTLTLLLVFAALALGLHWPEDFTAYPTQKELRLFSLTALAAFAPLVLLQEDEERLAFLYLAAIIGAIMAVAATVEVVGSANFSRVGVFNTNPILLGRASGFCAVLLCVLYWLGYIRLWVFVPAAVVVLFGVIVSGSRGPLLAFIVVIVMLVALCATWRPSWTRLGSTVVATGLGMTVTVIYLDAAGVYPAERLLRLLSGDWRGAELSRLAIWEQTSDLISQTPFGVGWGWLTAHVEIYHRGIVLQHPHNIFLEIAAEGGWLPAAVFSALVGSVAVVSLRHAYGAARNPVGIGPLSSMMVFSAFTYWLLCASFSGDVNDNRPLWAVIGMALAAYPSWRAQGTRRDWQVAEDLAEPTAPPARKRVLHVSSAHRVSDDRICRKEAVALWDAGYDITVLGLKKADGTVLPDGPRFMQYAAPASRARRFLIRLPWLVVYCTTHRYDAYHLHDPDLILLGFFLKSIGRRVIYDVHESYPMVVLDREWIPRPLRPLLSRLWRRLEAAFVRCADLTVAAHDSVRRQFNAGTVITVCNFPDLEKPAAVPPVPMAQRPLRVVHHGDLTEQRGLVTMVDAIAEVRLDEEPNLRLAGSLRPAMQERIGGRPGMRRTTYLGWLDHERLAEELAQARAGLVLLHPTNNYLVIRPNKLFAYMAAGLPVVVSDFPHWRAVVEPAACGILVDPLDPSAIARAIEYVVTHPEEAAAMGARGREAVTRSYNWRSEKEKLIAGYRQLFDPRREAAAYEFPA